MINILHRNDEFVTFYNKFSKILPSNSMHLENRVRSSQVAHLSLSSHTFVWAAAAAASSQCGRANRLVYPLSFCKLPSSSKPPKKTSQPEERRELLRFTLLHVGNHLQINRHIPHIENIFSQ